MKKAQHDVEHKIEMGEKFFLILFCAEELCANLHNTS